MIYLREFSIAQLRSVTVLKLPIKILICQASADIYFCLSLYEKFVGKFRIVVLVMNNKNYFTFFKHLALSQCEIVFIPYPKKGTIYFLEIVKSRIRNFYLFQNQLKQIQGADFYFFSLFYDYVGFYFIKHLERRNKGYLIDHYDLEYTDSGNYTFKAFINWITFSFLAGKCLKTVYLNQKSTLCYGDGEEKFDKLDRKNYQLDPTPYSLKVPSQQRTVLLFESDDLKITFTKYPREYEKVMLDIINLLKKEGFKIYLKPHPRLGTSSFLLNHDLEIIPDFIPGEFIEYKSFTLVLGIWSKVIANIANQYPDVKVFSLIDLLPFNDNESREYYRRFLLMCSDSKMSFFYSMQEIEKFALADSK